MTIATVLVVCTGNIRRSPAIEALLRHGSADVRGLEASGLTVASAGVRALAGEPMDDLIARQLEAFGIDASGHVARQLTADQIESADLVVTCERHHRSEVVKLVPAAVQRAFTLRELAGLGEGVGRTALGGQGVDAAARLRELVRLAKLERARRIVRRPSDDDLADLTRSNERAARKLVTEARVSVEALLRLVEPEPNLSIVNRPASAQPSAEGEAKHLSAG